jgi:hypothetical protein
VWERVHDASKLPQPGTGHFFANFDSAEWLVEPISTHLFGTLSEIKALAAWLSRHATIRSLLIVSSATHSKRIQMCCRRLLPGRCGTRVIAVPVEQASSEPALPRERTGIRRTLAEWAKVLLYRFVLPFYRKPTDAGEKPRSLATD